MTREVRSSQTVKTAVIWDATPSSLVRMHQYVRQTCCLCIQDRTVSSQVFTYWKGQNFIYVDLRRSGHAIQCISAKHFKFPNMPIAFPAKNASEEGDRLLSHNYIFGLKYVYVLGMPKNQERFQMSDN